MKTEGFPEIIEIIDDDVDAFGDRSRAGTIHDTGGPRWVGPAAAVALLAFIGFGVVTSASSSGVPDVAPATTTTVVAPTPSTVASASIPATPPQPVSYYAADPPREFTVQYANVQALDDAPFEGYAYELWATADSSATSGSWFSVATYRGASSLTAIDAYRLQAGRLSIAISHPATGQTIAQYTQDGRMGVTINSFGWSDADLVRLATSIQADERSISFTDTWFKPAHKLVSTVQPWLAVQSIPAQQVTYVSGRDQSSNIIITVGQLLQPTEGGAPEPRQAALRFLLDRNTPFTVAANAAVAGNIVSQPGRALATWIDDDQVITVSGSLPVSQIIAVARSVHQVSPQEWEGMKFQATRSQANAGSYERSESHDIASGADAASEPWAISVATATSGGQKQISWTWTSNGFVSYPTDAAAELRSVVNDGRTYVLADLPRSVAATATLVIDGDGVQQNVPLADIGQDFDRTFAAFAFSEPVPFSASIVGADGTVLANWPTP